MNEDIFDSIAADIIQDESSSVELVQPEPVYEMMTFTFIPDNDNHELILHDYKQKAAIVRSIYHLLCGNQFRIEYKKLDSLPGLNYYLQFKCPNMFDSVKTAIMFFYYILRVFGDEEGHLIHFEFRNISFLPVGQSEEQVLNNSHFRSLLKDHIFNKHRYISKKLYTKLLLPLYSNHIKDAIENYLETSLDDFAIKNIAKTFRWKEGLNFIEYDEEQTQRFMKEGINHMRISYLNDYNICTQEINMSNVTWMRNFMSHGDFYKVRWFKFIGFDVTTKQNSHTAMLLCLVTHPLFTVETIELPFFKVAFWSKKKKIRDYSTEELISRMKKMTHDEK